MKLTPDSVRALLVDLDPAAEWLVEVIPPPPPAKTRAELLADMLRPAAFVLDQGGAGTVAEVTVESDARLIAAAPDLARELLAAVDHLRAVLDEADSLRSVMADMHQHNGRSAWLDRVGSSGDVAGMRARLDAIAGASLSARRWLEAS